MNELMNINGEIKMTTVEIAELTGKNHNHVVRDTKVMLIELYGKEGLTSFGQTYIHPQNKQEYPCYGLFKNDVIVLVSGYSIKLRKKIVDRLEELENKNDPIVMLNDPDVLRRTLLSYSETVIKQKQIIQDQEPKVKALDRISTANGSLCITDAAKQLQVQPSTLFDWLSFHKWIYKRVGSSSGWIAYQRVIQQGLIEHKTTILIRPDGSEKATTQARITPKGLTKLSEMFSSDLF